VSSSNPELEGTRRKRWWLEFRGAPWPLAPLKGDHTVYAVDTCKRKG